MKQQQPPRAEIMLEVRLDETSTHQDSRRNYETIYSQVGNIAQSQSFYLWVLELLQLQPGELYLDVSCGQGELLYLAQGKGTLAYGLDLSHNALGIGQRLFGCRRAVAANSQQLPYKSNSFNVISNIGSLEHYLDMSQAVREMARVMMPDGRAFILVPNTFSLLTNVWIAFRQGRTSIDLSQPIQRYAARYEWQELLEENGLVVYRTLKYERERPRIWRDFWTYVRYPKQMIRFLLSPLVPLNLAWSFVFVCRKAN
jgi:ubiquinone/menaquinone biosynthesis C-methylase UbiE